MEKESLKDKKARLCERKRQSKLLRKKQAILKEHSLSTSLIKQVEKECAVLEYDIKKEEIT